MTSENGWATVSIWRPKDTSEAGPKVDEEPAIVTIDDGGDFALVIHIANKGPSGLWTVAATVSMDEARRLGHELLKGAGDE